MVFTDDGRNKIRDLVSADFSKGMVGTDTTAATISDSSLGSSVSGTNYSLTLTTADKQFVVDYNLPSTVGNGEDITEFGIFNSDNLLYARFVFSSLTKSSTEQWQFSTRIRIV